ncbi:MAG: class I SAM-dependent methyltransferase [Balneolaceae bacterium]
MKEQIKEIPILGKLAMQLYWMLIEFQAIPMFFPGSRKYWEDRYAAGGHSGVGSYDKFAVFKADIINSFVSGKNIQSVIEFGCGDGNQLKLADYPSYTGFDISETAITLCRRKFSSCPDKSFRKMSEYNREMADLSLSLDVIYHLVEDDVFNNYMQVLFESASRHVIIYSSNSDRNAVSQCAHVKHRKFTDWIRENAPDWVLSEHIPNKYPYRGDFRTGSFADFYIFGKKE